jgi:hypothetical protein
MSKLSCFILTKKCIKKEVICLNHLSSLKIKAQDPDMHLPASVFHFAGALSSFPARVFHFIRATIPGTLCMTLSEN